MSWMPAREPECQTAESIEAVDLIIEARSRNLGDLTVGRVLPSPRRRLVGPFIFFDHMGPAEFAPGHGIDVRPHPHINLATVTYLFEGQLVHRDSLGFEQPIRPGAVNWMTAGRGIAHSERTAPDDRAQGHRINGIQLWVALPTAHEEVEPSFSHHPADTLPQRALDSVTVRVLAGSAFGLEAPVPTFSPLFYAEAMMKAGTVLALPDPDEHRERAAYIANGAIRCGDTHHEAGRMLVFSEGAKVSLKAETDARVMLLGGAPLDGERHIWWNFVSSSPERLERAKADWKAGRFPKIPGDDKEFIPLPD